MRALDTHNTLNVFPSLVWAHSLQPLSVPNPPALRLILPRFSYTYLVWKDPEPFVGDILGVQILYLIDGDSQNIQELGSGSNHYSVSGIKNSVGKTHSVSLRARTSAGWGQYSIPIQFTFRPIGKAVSMQQLFLRVPCVLISLYPVADKAGNANCSLASRTLLLSAFYARRARRGRVSNYNSQ